MKRIAVLLGIVILGLGAKAQGLSDVYDFSQSFYQGTAKSAAMGNAMGAVGQDFSAISINPAGLGLFRHSTVVFTPGLYLSNSKSEYNGSTSITNDIRMPINNVGVVLTFPKNGFLKSVNFAFGMNRTNNYTRETYASGNNLKNSLIDAYMGEIADYGIHNDNDLESFSPYVMFPLWDCYLLDFSNSGEVSTIVPMGNLNQQRGVLRRGYIDEIPLSFSLNFDDKWFIGASLNIKHLERGLTASYKETNLGGGDLIAWMQEEFIRTYGWGVGAKLGVIGFPAKWLRLGLSFQTPSLFNMEEDWSTRTTSRLRNTNHNNNENNTRTSTYTYKFTTPLRFDASAAFILSNRAMLSFDYELVNYRNASLSCSDYDYSDLNSLIANTYKISSNFRAGGEYRIKNVCLRAGYALYGSPFGLGEKEYRTSNCSAGIGYTVRSFTFDVAYVFSQMKNSYYIYSPYSNYVPSGDDVVTNTVHETDNTHQLLLSFKFRID